MDSMFSVDAPFANTIKWMIVNPGKLMREYLSGKRKSYYKPVGFFIIMTLIYLVVRSIINYDPFVNSNIEVTDPTQKQLLTQARDNMLLNIDKFMFVLVFMLGLLLKLSFWRKRSLAEFFAISFYLVGVYTFIGIFNMLFNHYINPSYQFLAMLIMLVYFCYAMVSFFQKKKILVLIKSMVIFVIGFITYGLSAFALSYLIIYLKQP